MPLPTPITRGYRNISSTANCPCELGAQPDPYPLSEILSHQGSLSEYNPAYSLAYRGEQTRLITSQRPVIERQSSTPRGRHLGSVLIAAAAAAASVKTFALPSSATPKIRIDAFVTASVRPVALVDVWRPASPDACGACPTLRTVRQLHVRDLGLCVARVVARNRFWPRCDVNLYESNSCLSQQGNDERENVDVLSARAWHSFPSVPGWSSGGL